MWDQIVFFLEQGLPNFFCQWNRLDIKYLPPEILMSYFNNLTTHLHVHSSLMLANGHMTCK